MFCDVVGFTALSAVLDPEDLSAVIRNYQATVAETLERFGGFIARYVGDGVLIYFGWPEAREADAERAVRAALAVISEVSRTPSGGERLRLRIGIATGLVVIGETIGYRRSQTTDGDRRDTRSLPLDCKISPATTASSSTQQPDTRSAACSTAPTWALSS